MNFDKIRENVRIQNKLREAGIYPIMGPTGPQGKGLEIKGDYDTFDQLIEHHPIGNNGDSYLVNGILYIWDSEKNEWISGGNIKGPKGDTERIIVYNTITGEQGSEAQVIDNQEDLIHNLTFIIPKGDKGDIGPKGEQGVKGDKGDTGSIGPTGPEATPLQTSYNAILFVSYDQAKISQIMTYQESVNIPEDNDVFKMLSNALFSVQETGYYEITLCGQISGVDATHGAIFYLSNSAGQVIQDLSFELKAGSTTRMDCSETVVTKIDTPTNLYVRCGIVGDAASANIDFSNINLIIKKYNVSI